MVMSDLSSNILQKMSLDQFLKRRVILALQKAIVSRFNEDDWQELGYQTGFDIHINNHPRLLRSLKWNDPDYGGHVYKTLEYFFSEGDRKPFDVLFSHPEISNEVMSRDPTLLSDLGVVDQHVKPVAVKSLSASEVVEIALKDADQLLHTSGPLSAIDRLHTALHGYIRQLCNDSGLDASSEASLTALFSILRKGHPSFTTDTSDSVERILKGFSTALDAINTIRNQRSIAHPNDVLLGEDEANLVVNAIRTIFHYLQAKVG